MKDTSSPSALTSHAPHLPLVDHSTSPPLSARPSLNPHLATPQSMDPLILEDGSFSASQFSDLWLLGVPIVVRGIERRLQGKWTPDDFIHDYGPQKVTPIDCLTGMPVKSPSRVETFFRLLKQPLVDGAHPIKLKVCPFHVNRELR